MQTHRRRRVVPPLLAALVFALGSPGFAQDPEPVPAPAPVPAPVPAPAPATATKGPALAVLLKAAGIVEVFAPETGASMRTFRVGVGPHEAAAAPDGRTIVVCNYGEQLPGSTLTVLDLDGTTEPRTIDLAPYHRPHGIQFLPDGKSFVVTAETQRKLLVVELATGKVTAALDTAQHVSHMVALDPSGKLAYVTNLGSRSSVAVIDLARGERVTTIPTDQGTEGIAVHPKTGAVWVSNRNAGTVQVVDPKTNAVVATLPCDGFPIRVAFAGERALVTCAEAGDLAVFDVETRTLLRRIALGEPDAPSPMPVGVLVAPSGEVFVATMRAGEVLVVDVDAGKVLRRIAAAPVPDGMAWASNVARAAASK